MSHEGLKQLSVALAAIVEEERAKRPALEAARPVIRPKAVGRSVEITVRKTRKDGEEVYQVRGDKPERWVRQTDFSNDEAVGYLADRLNAAGVEDELMKAGAFAGDTIVIGDVDGGVVFDWEPTCVWSAILDRVVRSVARCTTRSWMLRVRLATSCGPSARPAIGRMHRISHERSVRRAPYRRQDWVVVPDTRGRWS